MGRSMVSALVGDCALRNLEKGNYPDITKYGIINRKKKIDRLG